MNVVKFPGLNLSFEFSKSAFNIFGIEVYKYAVCIVLGIVVALILCKLNKEKFNIDDDFILENVILGIIAGVIGARFYYILFNLQYFINKPEEILNFRNGGLAIYGGLIFGAIAIIINCKIKKKDILDFFDCIIPYVAIAQCIGRLGNFFNLEAYGYETKSILRMGININNRYMEVHPTFLYEMVSTFIISIILIRVQKIRKYKGQIILLYLCLYGFIRAIIEGLRIDSLMLFDFRISQVLSIIFCLVAVVLLLKNRFKNRSTLSEKK